MKSSPMTKYSLIFAFLILVLVACDKAPSGVIKESDMVDLVVDLHKADAYIDNYPSQYASDSAKMVLKQSVFAKHGVTQSDYDSSLVWYAHNMDVYIGVYKKVIDRLSRESSRNNDYVGKTDVMATNSYQNVTQSYRSVSGDSADLWTQTRSWTLPQGLNTGYIPFDYDTDREHRLGDCFELKYKSILTAGTLAALFALDYSDGGTTYVYRTATNSGWNKIILQSDSTRTVRRIYGYMNYQLVPSAIIYVDSVQLVRTHLDRSNYDARINSCQLVERMVKSDRGEDGKNKSSAPIVEHQFVPKQGLHKPSISPHIIKSPNAAHLPHNR